MEVISKKLPAYEASPGVAPVRIFACEGKHMRQTLQGRHTSQQRKDRGFAVDRTEVKVLSFYWSAILAFLCIPKIPILIWLTWVDNNDIPVKALSRNLQSVVTSVLCGVFDQARSKVSSLLASKESIDLACHLKIRQRAFGRHQLIGVLLLYMTSLCCVDAQDTDYGVLPQRRLSSATQAYSTAGTYSFTVPTGVTMVTASLYGASGGTVSAVVAGDTRIGNGGKGGMISATIPVVPGEILQINVGGQGGTSTAGVNGGGMSCVGGSWISGGGGGASDIRRSPYSLLSRLIVAGGGGGGYSYWTASGGAGGYPAGANGDKGFAGALYPPTGGTQIDGGTMPVGAYCYNAGLFGIGASCCGGTFGGGGGGGYWGGGNSDGTGGGGGSSYVSTVDGVQLVTHDVTTNAGSGSVTLTFAGDPTVYPTVAPSTPTSQPTGQPSRQPSSQPSRQPSAQPSRQPTRQPSNQPSSQPSRQPTRRPSNQPTTHPSSQPSTQPTRRPTLFSRKTFDCLSVGSCMFTVPVGVTVITATLYGASGGSVATVTEGRARIGFGGKGGTIIADITVTPGNTLQINVGGQGGGAGPGGAGANGGGAGCNDGNYQSGDGGGASDVRRSPYALADRIVVAGGGGGTFSYHNATGGAGGYPKGQDGSKGTGGQYPASGGTATAGGTTTNINTVHCYVNGTFGFGASCCGAMGGGGGGGYWGGGMAFDTSGGGGSSYVGSGAMLVHHGVALTAGPGRVTLTYTTPDPTSQPARQPSRQPSGQPSSLPTKQPVSSPSTQPSRQPTRQPTRQPSGHPSSQPSAQPTRRPTLFSSKTFDCLSVGSCMFTVPVGVTVITATLYGASGGSVATFLGNSKRVGYGGLGGIIITDLTVTPGNTLQINVGGQGGGAGPGGAGANGGGAGCADLTYLSGDGGGASDVRRPPYALADRIVVAGGGGGAYAYKNATGGAGGYPNGADGAGGYPVTGGTSTSGGTTMNINWGQCYVDGTFGFGASCCGNFGGGGGGGYWGGATAYDTSGSGGSSYVGSGAMLVSHGVALTAGPGRVTLTYTIPDPTSQPTRQPSRQPSGQPSSLPTKQPVSSPSIQPSAQPTSIPSAKPSVMPSSGPTARPTSAPSALPTFLPSAQPSSQPTRVPTTQPSTQPSSKPSCQPSGQPSSKPSAQPSVQPSSKPSAQPSDQPSVQPSSKPSLQSSNYPSCQPSTQPTMQPSMQPNDQPTNQPTMQPTTLPSTQPTSKPSTQPTVKPSSPPTIAPTAQPSKQPTGVPSMQPIAVPTTQPTGQPSNTPSTQPTMQPSRQPHSHPTSQPSQSPTALPTQLFTAREFVYLMPLGSAATWHVLANRTWHVLANSDSGNWACSSKAEISNCVVVSAQGMLRAQYPFQWNTTTSVLQTNDLSAVVVGGHTYSGYDFTSHIATCAVSATPLQCNVKSFVDTKFTAGAFASAVNKVIYIGSHSVHASMTVFDCTLNDMSSYRYVIPSMPNVELKHVHIPPDYIGSFVAGTSTSVGSVTYIFAATVRTDSGTMTGMYMKLGSDIIVNSAELVSSMALEYTQPNTYIGGGFQTLREPIVTAYVLCVNALFQSVLYGRRFRLSLPGRRKLTESIGALYSVVKGVVITENFVYVLISWNTTVESNVLNRISLLKMDLALSTIQQQVHIASHAASIHCSHIIEKDKYFTMACSVLQASTNDARALLLSADEALTFSMLPEGFIRYENEAFSMENLLFQRTKLLLSVQKINSRDFTVTDGPTASPTAVSTMLPTMEPSSQPSSTPSTQPSSSPTSAPSVSPQPTSHPSSSGPTNTYKPTVRATHRPTPTPTTTPTASPTLQPTVIPTARPSLHPIAIAAPTPQPSVFATTAPTRTPLSRRTLIPTVLLSSAPSPAPSLADAAASKREKPATKSAVFILLYVLGGLTGLWCINRILQWYQQTLDWYAQRRKVRAHLEAILQSQNSPLSHTRNLPTRVTTFRELFGSSVRTGYGAHANGAHANGARANGALTDNPPATGAYAVSPSNNTATSPVASEDMHNRPRSVGSSSSSSVVLSSLHGSEMSDLSYSIGSDMNYLFEKAPTAPHVKSKENAMEEGGGHCSSSSDSDSSHDSNAHSSLESS